VFLMIARFPKSRREPSPLVGEGRVGGRRGHDARMELGGATSTRGPRLDDRAPHCVAAWVSPSCHTPCALRASATSFGM